MPFEKSQYTHGFLFSYPRFCCKICKINISSNCTDLWLLHLQKNKTKPYQNPKKSYTDLYVPLTPWMNPSQKFWEWIVLHIFGACSLIKQQRLKYLHGLWGSFIGSLPQCPDLPSVWIDALVSIFLLSNIFEVLKHSQQLYFLIICT